MSHRSCACAVESVDCGREVTLARDRLLQTVATQQPRRFGPGNDYEVSAARFDPSAENGEPGKIPNWNQLVIGRVDHDLNSSVKRSR